MKQQCTFSLLRNPLFSRSTKLVNQSLTCGEEELRLSSPVFTLRPEVEPAASGGAAAGSSGISSSVLTRGAGSTTIEGLPVLPGISGFECCLWIDPVVAAGGLLLTRQEGVRVLLHQIGWLGHAQQVRRGGHC